MASPLLPVETKSPPAEYPGVEWRKLGRDSTLFLTIMHGFRWATEPGTRAGGIGLGAAYMRSVGNLHGWSDGDPFYVNYVGHPMQGAVSGRLYLLNDPGCNRTEFGKSREYWKGRLRAATFAWALSEQFEIGPLSEASIGHIQADYPQQGFVDHVITPTIGFAWMLGEDAIDRYMIQPVEDRTGNRWIRLALRTGLNPARSFANLIDGRTPWHRSSRSGVLQYTPESSPRAFVNPTNPVELPSRAIAPFEFSVEPGWRQFEGGACVGGGAEGAYRLRSKLQVLLAVNGCKLLGLEPNTSGDALIYQVGPRWTPAPSGRWSPYAHVLVGGMKITQERIYPNKKQLVLEANKKLEQPMPENTLHGQYTTHEEADGLAISVGTGLDCKLNAVLALRVASLEYLRSSVGTVGSMPYSHGLQVTTGMVLRIGTW